MTGRLAPLYWQPKNQSLSIRATGLLIAVGVSPLPGGTNRNPICSRKPDRPEIFPSATRQFLPIGIAGDQAPNLRRLCRVLQATSLALVLCIVFVLVSGCASQFDARFDEAILSKRTENLGDWESVRLDNTLLMSVLQKRTATVFRNHKPGPTTLEGRIASFNVNLRPDGMIGAAVPIAEDGYFLTAGHLVHGADSLILLATIEQEGDKTNIQQETARVVWEPHYSWDGQGSSPWPDFAVIHAEIRPLFPFSRRTEALEISEPVIIAGSSIRLNKEGPRVSRMAAGFIVSVEEQQARAMSPAFVVVRHNAPVISGDSGGPILNRRGNLIGVNSSTTYSTPSVFHWLAISLGRAPTDAELEGYYATAYMPDPDWLQQIVESDRRSLSSD